MKWRKEMRGEDRAVPVVETGGGMVLDKEPVIAEHRGNLLRRRRNNHRPLRRVDQLGVADANDGRVCKIDIDSHERASVINKATWT